MSDRPVNIFYTFLQSQRFQGNDWDAKQNESFFMQVIVAREPTFQWFALPRWWKETASRCQPPFPIFLKYMRKVRLSQRTGIVSANQVSSARYDSDPTMWYPVLVGSVFSMHRQQCSTPDQITFWGQCAGWPSDQGVSENSRQANWKRILRRSQFVANAVEGLGIATAWIVCSTRC